MEKQLLNIEQLRQSLPDTSNVNIAWLHKLAPQDLVLTLRQHMHASRLFQRILCRRYRLTIPDKVDLKAHQQWVFLSNAKQKLLARQLGCLACVEFIRMVVKKDQVNALIQVLDVEEYRELLQYESLAVENLLKQDFDTSIRQNRLEYFVIGVGIGLLQLTLPRDTGFFKQRMRFVFSPECWSMRYRDLSMDLVLLENLILKIVTDLNEESQAEKIAGEMS